MQVVVACRSCGFFEILQSDWYFTILRMKHHGTNNLPSFYQTLFQAQRKGSGLGMRLIYHEKSHDFLWNNWIFHGKSCDFLWYIWIFHGKSHDSHWAKKIIEMIYLPERKIERGETCELTSPVSYKECASRPYLSYRNLKTSVGFVVAMVRIRYTMPTRGVSRIYEAITINAEGVARGINGYC